MAIEDELCGARTLRGGGRLGGPIELSRGPRFQRTPFHQRVAPAAQRWNMDINPIVPPVNRFRREAEDRLFVRRQCSGEQSGIFRFKNVFVVQNEWLV